ncbi:alkaline phosphatase family protein [Dermacoccaceae bacterium W4C1]
MTEPGPPLLPRYDDQGLAGVLPAVLASLGGPTPPETPVMALPPARRAVVVLVDGLGLRMLERRRGHAPFLRSMLAGARPLTAGFPSTTATSMGSFGTGLPPGAHGLTGYQVRDPDTGRLFNELSWEEGPQPRRWQPEPTVFERAERAGICASMIGPHYFDGSGLTTAALRGATFRSGKTLAERVDATLARVRADRQALVYLYWGEIDRAAHQFGCDSVECGDEIEALDAELSRLSRSLPGDTSLTVVADHGMVDVPLANRIDIAADPELASGVEVVAGEVRAVQLHLRPGAAQDVLATYRARFAEHAWVRSRREAVEQGWFGPVTERVLPRIGEVVLAFRDDHGLVDSRVMRPLITTLIGQHGSLTEDELLVPMLHRAAPQAG